MLTWVPIIAPTHITHSEVDANNVQRGSLDGLGRTKNSKTIHIQVRVRPLHEYKSKLVLSVVVSCGIRMMGLLLLNVIVQV